MVKGLGTWEGWVIPSVRRPRGGEARREESEEHGARSTSLTRPFPPPVGSLCVLGDLPDGERGTG